jgi:topoisomerase IV subunit A
MRLRSLRKLEEMEIRREHESLTKEQKELKKLLGSDKLKDERLLEEVKAIDAKFGLKTKLGARRTEFVAGKALEKIQQIAEVAVAVESAVEREPITIVCSTKGWLRSLKGHQEENDSIKYREGDRGRFWVHAETTDRLMLFSTDGRFFTLDCAKLPGGRGNGEAIRSFIDLPPESDIVAMFAHKEGRKLLLASDTGHGFVTNEDDAVAMTRSGKRVMNVKQEAAACAFVEGDTVALIGDNRKMILFPLSEVPELARGQGVYLQRYKDGGLLDATVFTWKDGLKDENNRLFEPSELKDWRGARAQAGRLAPRGWAKSGKFAH